MDHKFALVIDGRRMVVTGREGLALTVISQAESGDLSLIKMLLHEKFVHTIDPPQVIVFEKGDEKL